MSNNRKADDMSEDLTFDAATHTYRIGTRRLPSVTEIIRETLGVGWSADPWYMQRGTAVHACCALLAKGKQFQNDHQIDGYVTAARQWFSDVRPEVLLVEQPLCSQVYGYAGTCDLVARIGKTVFVIDWKSHVDEVRVKIQLGGYAAMLAKRYPVLQGLGVEIRDDGTYKQSGPWKLPRHIHEFLACLTVFNLKRSANGQQQKGEHNERNPNDAA